MRIMDQFAKGAIAATLFLGTLSLSACGGDHAGHGGGSVSADFTIESADGLIEIAPGFVRTPSPGALATAGYLSLRADADDRLLRATSPLVGTVEIHTMEMADGVMQMRPVDGIDLPAGEAVALAPQGMHLMMLQPQDSLAVAEETTVTLYFEYAEPVTVTLPVHR